MGVRFLWRIASGVRVSAQNQSRVIERNMLHEFSLKTNCIAQGVIGSIVWAFCTLKKPRIGEMSARGYALHSVCFQCRIFPFSYIGGKTISQSLSRNTGELCKILIPPITDGNAPSRLIHHKRILVSVKFAYKNQFGTDSFDSYKRRILSFVI